MISSKLGYDVVAEKSDQAAGCQFIPLPQGGAIVTCPAEFGKGQGGSVNPYLGIGIVVIVLIILAIAFGLKLKSTSKPHKP